MSVRSHEAFLEQIRSGKRKTVSQLLYSFIDYYVNTHNEKIDLPEMLNSCEYPHQTVTARLSELCDMGVIYEDDNGYFNITPEDKILQYAAKRDDEKYRKWKKLGEKNGWFNQLRIV